MKTLYVGYEKQWRWNCPECEAPLAYQSRPFEEKAKKENIKEGDKFFLYTYNNAIIKSVADCRVAQEVAKMNSVTKV